MERYGVDSFDRRLIINLYMLTVINHQYYKYVHLIELGFAISMNRIRDTILRKWRKNV